MKMVNTSQGKTLEWEDENGNINPEVVPTLTPNEIRVLRGVLLLIPLT